MNEEEEEMFLKPMQKQEIIQLLKKYNLLDEKNLNPLKQLTDTDYINLDLSAFYWHLLMNKDTSSSSNTSKSSKIEIEKTLQNMSSCDFDILDCCGTLEKIQWSKLMEPENEDQFEELENTLMQLDSSMVASSWEQASLKVLEEYAKTVLNDEESREGLSKDAFNECITDCEGPVAGGLNYVLIDNQEKNMKKVLDLDKRIKDLMEELGDEKKKKKLNERPSLHANSVLNDTLEEMEVLMKCGESYMTRESILNQLEIKSFIRSKSEDSIFERNKAALVPKYAEQSYKTPELKKKKFTPSSSSEFKVPMSRAPRRQIPSPIGTYIKNSPNIPLIKKVVSTPITGHGRLVENYREVLKENKSTPIKLPTKTYKPAARTLFVEKENHPKIPKSIQKLYTSPVPQIIKHIGQVPSNNLLTGITHSEFENSADLTVLDETNKSEDNSIFCTNESDKEVSLYVCKQPLHSNSLHTNRK